MKYQDGKYLSIPEAKELAALKAPLSLDGTSTLDNSALARSLALESSARCYIEPTAMALAGSAIWRLMCDELVAAAADEERLRLAFLMASARLFVGGAEAERTPE